MNLATLIRGNLFIIRATEHLLKNQWTPVSFEQMSNYLFKTYYRNCPGNFVLFNKVLLGNVSAYVFIGAEQQRQSYAVFCIDDYLTEKRFYNTTNMDLFKVNLRSFVIKNSSRY